MTSGAEHGQSARATFGAFATLGLVVAEVVTGLCGALSRAMSFADIRDSFMLTNAAIALSCAVAGVLIAWQRPRNPVGWLLLAAGAFQGGTAATVPFLIHDSADVAADPTQRTIATVVACSWPWSIALCLPLALLLFPDGRLLSRRWRVVVGAIAVEGPLFALEAGADPGAIPHTARPWLTISAYHDLGWLWTGSELLNGAIYLACLAGLVLRYRRGDDRQRRQLLWLATALLALLAMLVVWVPSQAGGPEVFVLLVIPLVPAAITIAVLRHQLLDIRLVFTRALLYAVLTAGVVGSYLGLVAFADQVLRSTGLGGSVIATLVVALGFNPVRVRLQRRLERWLYGDRTDPVRAVSRLGRQLVGAGGDSGTGDALKAVREALRLPYAALRVDGVVQAAHGDPDNILETVALTYQGNHVGDLLVGVRNGQGALDRSDRAVLELLAAPLAVAVHATTLGEAVQRSREQIVAAREEERRRLRRDLHDGLGPALTGMAFQADTARNLLRVDPDRADALLVEMRAHATDSITDVRRLVYALRPPSLDELGLVGALRRHTERLDGNGPTITVLAPEELRPLPAAVEVAAYRIAVEAITNAVRHADPSHIELEIAVDDDLEITVLNDGTAASRWEPGVGLTSMRERAAELGGTVDAGPRTNGGRVRARLPL